MQEARRLFEAEVRDDVRMVEVFERFDLGFERGHDALLARIFAIAGGAGQLDLLDSDHLTRGGVQGEVDPTVRALADQVTFDPLENGLWRRRVGRRRFGERRRCGRRQLLARRHLDHLCTPQLGASPSHQAISRTRSLGDRLLVHDLLAILGDESNRFLVTAALAQRLLHSKRRRGRRARGDLGGTFGARTGDHGAFWDGSRVEQRLVEIVLREEVVQVLVQLLRRGRNAQSSSLRANELLRVMPPLLTAEDRCAELG